MIGAALCRRSSPTPTPDMIEGNATTTTYVSAAAIRTAPAARARRHRSRWATPATAFTTELRSCGQADVHLLVVLVEREDVCRVGLAHERSDNCDLSNLVAFGV